MFSRNPHPLRPTGFSFLFFSPVYLLLKLRSALKEIPHKISFYASQYIIEYNSLKDMKNFDQDLKRFNSKKGFSIEKMSNQISPTQSILQFSLFAFELLVFSNSFFFFLFQNFNPFITEKVNTRPETNLSSQTHPLPHFPSPLISSFPSRSSYIWRFILFFFLFFFLFFSSYLHNSTV